MPRKPRRLYVRYKVHHSGTFNAFNTKHAAESCVKRLKKSGVRDIRVEKGKW